MQRKEKVKTGIMAEGNPCDRGGKAKPRSGPERGPSGVGSEKTEPGADLEGDRPGPGAKRKPRADRKADRPGGKKTEEKGRNPVRRSA